MDKYALLARIFMQATLLKEDLKELIQAMQKEERDYMFSDCIQRDEAFDVIIKMKKNQERWEELKEAFEKWVDETSKAEI